VFVPTLVLVVCGAVVLVGATVELLDTVRAYRAPGRVAAADRAGLAADVGRWPMLAWFGLAAGAVLVAAALARRQPAVDDVALVVLILGFAADRAYYLVRRQHSDDGRAVRTQVIALLTGVIGLLAGFTL
jgi:hypothetical protein